MKHTYKHVKIIGLLAYLLISSVFAQAQEAELVADVNQYFSQSDAINITVIDDKIYFAARHREAGYQLYIFDGASAEVIVISDYISRSNAPTGFTKVGDKVCFSANVGNGMGRELWVYDGVEVEAIDIYPGGQNSTPDMLISYNDKVYFSANNGTNGIELYEYDGTTASVIDINTGSGNSSPEDFFVHDGKLYFYATDDINGHEPRVFDGTSVSLLEDINPGTGSSYPSGLEPYFAAYDGDLFFSARPTGGGQSDQFVYVYDGISTQSLDDATGGDTGLGPREYTVYDGDLYYMASVPATGTELWVFDGTTAQLAQDLYPGSDSGSPRFLHVYEDELVFSAIGDGIGREFWTFDGTDYTSHDLGTGDTYPVDFINSGGNLYFRIAANTAGEFGMYNGTDATLVDIASGNRATDLYRLTAFDTYVVFSFDDLQLTDGKHLWKYENEALEYIEVNDETDGSDPINKVVLDDKIYFQANDENYNLEVFVYDGNITARLADLLNTDAGINTAGLVRYQDKIIYGAEDESGNNELFICDGTNLEIIDLRTSGDGSPDHFTIFNDLLYFTAYDEAGKSNLYQYDGTTISMAADLTAWTSGETPFSFLVFNNELLFIGNDGVSGRELWRFDGSSVSLVGDLTPGATGTYIARFTQVDDVLYCVAGSPNALCKYDGTDFGYVDLVPGDDQIYPIELAAYNGDLVFNAEGAVGVNEFWVYDGTDATMIEINPSGGSYPGSFTVFNELLYFGAYTPALGTELYQFDGTDVSLVADINPTGGSNAEDLFVVGPHLYLRAQNFSGAEDTKTSDAWVLSEEEELEGLFRFDGKSVDFVQEIFPDLDDAPALKVGNDVYFTAYSEQFGSELYRVRISSEETDITAFSLVEQTDVEIIDSEAHTVNIEVEKGADVSAFTPSISISEYASIAPQTATVQDFTSPVEYIVTAEFGNEQSWTVTVSSASNAIPTAISIDNTTLDENSAVGTIIGTMTTTDANANDTHTYSLVSGSGDTDNASFEVDGTQLKAKEVFDFETKSNYTVRVQTDDGDGGNFSKAIEITIGDVDDVVAGITDTQLNLVVYPNPTTEWMSFSGQLSPESYVAMFDMQGSKLLSQPIQEGAKISVAHLRPGLYLINFTDQNITTTTKILIER